MFHGKTINLVVLGDRPVRSSEINGVSHEYLRHSLFGKSSDELLNSVTSNSSSQWSKDRQKAAVKSYKRNFIVQRYHQDIDDEDL